MRPSPLPSPALLYAGAVGLMPPRVAKAIPAELATALLRRIRLQAMRLAPRFKAVQVVVPFRLEV